MAEPLRSIIPKAEGDSSVAEGFEPAVGDGDPQDIASQAAQGFVPAAGVQRVNHPRLSPDGRRSLIEQPGVSEDYREPAQRYAPSGARHEQETQFPDNWLSKLQSGQNVEKKRVK
jgi:hypothetical protein